MALMKCAECGGQVSDKASNCPHCGCPVARAAARCPECGGHVLPKASVCPHCGCPLEPSSGPQPGGMNTSSANFTNSLGMEFVLISPGSFVMGSDSNRDAMPRHPVTISRPFYLGRYPVMRGQWAAMMGNILNRFDVNKLFKEDTSRHPVVDVSWDDVQEFIRKLNRKEGHNRYRLPTEAEWEYACRAGTTTAYFFGDDLDNLGGYAWYSANSSGVTHPVGEKLPNAWGLYDMHGNVWEWCSDWYGKYPTGSALDPQGPPTGERRALRGGSWYEAASDCYTSCRIKRTPDKGHGSVGFRLALSL